MNDNVVIWRDTPVLIKHKCIHIKKIGGKTHNSFIIDYGDVPVGSINAITGKFEPCINHRGYGYAARKRMKYRKRRI